MAVLSNTIVAADLVPAITVDYTSRIKANIDQFREMLGVSDMIALPAGSTVNIYALSKYNSPDQVNEGDVINLTEIKRTVAKSLTMTLKKYRKLTTAEAIQKVGRDVAINKTDEKFIAEIQKEIKGAFFTSLKTGTGTTTAAATLQAQLANGWAAVQAGFEDTDFSPIHFVHPTTAAAYLGSASITTQNAFGLSYIEDFLGLGTLVITTAVSAGDVWSTAKENFVGYNVPMNGDALAEFGLTSDETGLIGMNHFIADDRASIATLALCGVVFAPELLDHVYKGTISEQ